MPQGADESIEKVEKMTDAEEAEMIGEIPVYKEIRDGMKEELAQLVGNKSTDETRMNKLRTEIAWLDEQITLREEAASGE